MIVAMVLLPAIAGILALVLRSDSWRRLLLVATAILHAGATTLSFRVRPGPALGGLLALDSAGLLILAITSTLFLFASVYAIGYLGREGVGQRRDFEEGQLFANVPEAVFTGCLLMFLATMTLVTVSHHLGLLWVAVEATTLASAPLIYFHRHHRSLEATWKYLMICSVGIALSLLGNFFLAVAASREGGHGTSMMLDDLLAQASSFHVPWLKAAFLCLLVGYGTKMGLAPLHTWLPDAHSEAPSVVSALLSGALLNCAFLGILRAQQLCVAAGQAAFGRDLLLGFGLLSIVFAAAFILGQTDYKRLLAYSSVEHMGILALGVGLGGAGTFGALLHAVNHAIAKAMLFFVAGNILAAYRTKAIADVRGVSRRLPISGALWIMGFLAITGSPPFGPFLSEFTILKAALDDGRGFVAVVFLAAMGAIFVGMASAFLKMAQGEPASGSGVEGGREAALAVLPPAALGALVLGLGIYVPPALTSVLEEAASVVSRLR